MFGPFTIILLLLVCGGLVLGALSVREKEGSMNHVPLQHYYIAFCSALSEV